MKKKGVNKEKIKEIISSNETIIEELIEDSKYLLRNKNWEDIRVGDVIKVIVIIIRY